MCASVVRDRTDTLGKRPAFRIPCAARGMLPRSAVNALQGPKRQPRATLGGAVQVNVGHNYLVGELCTLSPGGLLVAGLPSLSAGTKALIFFFLPRSDRPVVAEARALYELPGSAIGFSFQGLPSEEADRVNRAVASAAAIYLTLDNLVHFAPDRRSDIDELCKQVLLPTGLPLKLLRSRVALALQRLQLAA